MRVSVLLFQGCIALPAIGTRDLLLESTAFDRDRTRRRRLDVRLVACGEGREVRTAGGLMVRCDATLRDAGASDLIIVPALNDVEQHLTLNRACVPWVARQHARGADVASICTGAFVLAEAGLLDGRAATTHWAFQDQFRSRYPRVALLPHRIIVDEGRVCTSGGATAFLNLVVYLVEKYLGADAARTAGSMFLIDPIKPAQSVYAIFSGQKTHGDEGVLAAQQLIEGRCGDELTIDRLARAAAASRRNFIRRFKRATGTTPRDYVQRVRIERAKQLLASSRDSVGEIAAEVGYAEPAPLRKLFTRLVGISPGAYRARYSTLLREVST